MLTLLYSLLITSVLFLLPKILSKILLIIYYILMLILFLVHYMLFIIKDQVFTVYDLFNTQEGLTYINFIFKEIKLPLIIIIIISLILLIYTFKQINKIKKNLNFKKNILLIITSILIFILTKNLLVLSLENYENNFNKLLYPKYYYDEFVNRNRSMLVCGMYEYTFRDIYLYNKTQHSLFGSIEEIEKIMNENKITFEENEYTGVFKGKNLIMIMMESIDNIEINDKTMPTLNYIKNNSWNFTKRYSKNTSTINTEYTSITGLFYTDLIYNTNNNNYSLSLPNIFNKNGYITSSAHNNTGSYYNRKSLHKTLGFQKSYFLYDILGSKLKYNDKQMIEIDDIYNKIIPKDNNFMTFIITITGHGPYQNQDVCTGIGLKTEKECLDYKSKLTDDMLKLLLERLEEDKLLDDTVIILYSDHYPYAYNFTEEELSKMDRIDESYKIRNIPFMIYNKNIEYKEFNMLVNDIDIEPTILNLFGIEYNPNLFIGTDLLSKSHKNITIFPDYSWYDGNIYSLNNGVDTSSAYYKEISNYVKTKIDLNKMIVSNNYYKKWGCNEMK